MEEKKLLQLLRSMMRRASLRWPPAQAVRYGARVEQLINPLTGRLGWHSECAQCHTLVPEKLIRVDHIVPVGTLTAQNRGEAIARMFPLSSEHFQALCKFDHDEKTYRERYGKEKDYSKAERRSDGNSPPVLGRRKARARTSNGRKANRNSSSRRAVRIPKTKQAIHRA